MADPQPSDPIADVLRAVNTTQDVRAAAWDAYHNTANEDELATKLKALPLGDQVRAALWDAKRAESSGNPMNFAVVNKQAVPVPASPWQQALSGAGTFASEAWSKINPVSASMALWNAAVPTAANSYLPQGLQSRGPVATVQAIGARQGAVFDRVRDAYKRGDYLGAAIDFVNYLIPLAGPDISESGHQMREGQVMKGAGGAVGLGAGAVAPELISKIPIRTPELPSFMRSVRPATEAAAVQYGEAAGVPLDVATATGSKWARAVQKRAAHSIGGEGTASAFVGQQADALKALSDQLAAQAGPREATSETAGAGVRSGVSNVVKDLHAQANAAYTKLREIEAQPEASVKVPTAAEGTPEWNRLQAKIASGADDGRGLTATEVNTLRQMEAELDAMPFSQRRLQPTRYGGGLEPVEGTGGAGTPLYHDILQRAPGTAELTRAEVQNSIRKLLEEGEWTNAARGAVKLAREGNYRGPSLPIEGPGLGTISRMQMPIDLSSVKEAVAPIYTQLVSEGQLAPLMGGKADALRALHRLMTGSDQVPLTTAEAALGDLKTLARTDLPQLRTQGQGIAAKAVRELDDTIQMHAAASGDEVINLLKEGRVATAQKYQVGALLKKFRPMEDVAITRRLTAPRDSQIGLLRKVQQAAPDKIPDLGRAYLQQLFDMATAEGGFRRVDRLQAEWQKLGPETKKILFPRAGQVQELDHFFLLAKKIGENPNPSGTAHTLTALNVSTIPLTWTLAKILYSPTGARALTGGLTMDLSVTPVSKAVQTMTIANLLKAAKNADTDSSTTRP